MSTTPIEPISPNCFDCRNAEIEEGHCGSWDEPPMASEAYCLSEYGMTDVCYESEEFNAEECPGFDPKMVELCDECGAPINKPEYSWKLWGESMYDMVPVCSEMCVLIADDRTMQEIESMRGE